MKLHAKEGTPLSDPIFYRKLIGKLNFLTNTRMDISYSVQHLSQFMQDPREPHLKAAFHLLRYLKSDPTLGIFMAHDQNYNVKAYCDSDWAACPDSRKLVSGYIVLLGNSPLSWKLKKQETISLSSAEAEYRALRKVAGALVWLSGLLEELTVPIPTPIIVFCDSQSALHIARNPVFHERTKHIEVDCHFVRNLLQADLISLHHINSDNQLADVLTKTLTVLSAVSGIKPLGQEAIIYISVAILVVLFCVQRFGTDKVGYTFAPAISIWFLFISGTGLYNLLKHDVGILRAFNPMYIIDYFKRNGKKGWVSLGGVILCITGSEAMFADLGHFSVRSIQISFSCLVFPSILSAYIGQAAYLSKFPENVGNAFYASVPGRHKAKVVFHTSAKHEGQVYIPKLNYFLMVACVVVTISFKTTEKLGNAYAYGGSPCSTPVFVTIESTYLSAQLSKFVEGGYIPLTFSFMFVSIMGIWHYVQKHRYYFELNNKVSSDYIRDLSKNPDIKRVAGIGLLYSELVQGIPPIFPHFVSNIPSVHSIIILVSIKSIPISKVALEERFLFRHVEPREYKVFRCVVRLGYRDQHGKPEDFENQLIENLKEFIQQEHYILAAHDGQVADRETEFEPAVSDQLVAGESSSRVVNVEEELQQVDSRISSSTPSSQSNHPSSQIQVVSPSLVAEEEMQFVEKAKEQGVFYLLGEAEVVTEQDSSFLKKFVVNYACTFLSKNFRQGKKIMSIPQTRLLRIINVTYQTVKIQLAK
ncbi:hypothetical protein CQW23_05992 [Capsicum baccatum]|uniref:Potassium transporter 5 n=1 Tax=Capsicum baccatum TaxID=33114 RepID=A0A2G2X250_CAPBA|nr:hypothetical protein CQW23_05992 [Capsicum baccatum]